MYYFYVLESEVDHRFYYGITSDLKKRIKNHNQGKVKSTRSRRPFKLVYFETYLLKKDARIRELGIKNQGQQRELLKERIIKYNIMNMGA